jgi:hypothetical protein
MTIPPTESEIYLRPHPGGGSGGEFLILKLKFILDISCLKYQLSRFTLLHTAGGISARQLAVSTAQPHFLFRLCDSRSNPDCEISVPFFEVETTKKNPGGSEIAEIFIRMKSRSAHDFLKARSNESVQIS